MAPTSGERTLPAVNEYDSPLRMDAEQMRSIGYQTIDMLVRRLVDANVPPMRAASGVELSALIDSRAPEHPRGFAQPLAELEATVLTYASRLAHPATSLLSRRRARSPAPSETSSPELSTSTPVAGPRRPDQVGSSSSFSIGSGHGSDIRTGPKEFL